MMINDMELDMVAGGNNMENTAEAVAENGLEVEDLISVSLNVTKRVYGG